ncbi:MAG: hypothetical protein ACI9R7_001640 [Lysobacterales bacterium]|jgi:hypothetical protein
MQEFFCGENKRRGIQLQKHSGSNAGFQAGQLSTVLKTETRGLPAYWFIDLSVPEILCRCVIGATIDLHDILNSHILNCQ